MNSFETDQMWPKRSGPLQEGHWMYKSERNDIDMAIKASERILTLV